MSDIGDGFGPIDAVITWVDGNAPAHRAKRVHYMEQQDTPLIENARNPHRWESGDEIYYCLHSIHNHAPWLRRIWIVVDGKGPDLGPLSAALGDKIRITQHREIFTGHTHVLPTFNSLAIETVMWRIEGLAERFLYFNDDVFLTAPLQPSDVFDGMAPVLRGRWIDYSALAETPEARDDPAKFNHFVQVNAAGICGFDATRLFSSAHVVHPFRRSVMARLFEEHRELFEGNIVFRFRDLSQFSPQGLHNHASLKDGAARVQTRRDHLHIHSGQGVGQPPEETRALLMPEALRQTKFLCVNDLPQLEVLVPDAQELIAQAIGGMT